jgi:hypothetical protein
MLVPPELRKFKFEPVRRKGRLLGFADDDEPEILKGYIMLDEDTLEIKFIKEVIFNDEIINVLPLENDSDPPGSALQIFSLM